MFRRAQLRVQKILILNTMQAEFWEPRGEGRSSPWGVEASKGSNPGRRREFRSSLPGPSSPQGFAVKLQTNKTGGSKLQH